MNSGTTLASNERLKRLELLAQSALSRREFAKAEELWAEHLKMLSEYRYVDELCLAMTLNNLAFTQECQSKYGQAELHRKRAVAICAQQISAVPAKSYQKQQIRVARSA